MNLARVIPLVLLGALCGCRSGDPGRRGVAATHPRRGVAATFAAAPGTVGALLEWDATNSIPLGGFDFAWHTATGPTNALTLTNEIPAGRRATYQFAATNLPAATPISFEVRAFAWTNGQRLVSAPAALTWYQQWYFVVDLLRSANARDWTRQTAGVYSNLAVGDALFLKLEPRRVSR